MSLHNSLEFPDLIYLADFDGHFPSYFNAVYKVFENDFINSKPIFNGLVVSAQRLPLVDDIHRTFYHITHEGANEEDRLPDIRRMERIRFPGFMIGKCPHDELLVWKNQRGRDTRVLIFNEQEGYLIVLTERNGFYLFWTAYFIEKNHQRKKLLKEYEDYKKAKTA